MKISKKKFPFLFNNDVKWYFAKDYRGEEVPFSSDDLNESLQDKTLVRDYYSIAILDKHWHMFDEVYLSEIMQHWKHFQQEDYLIMNNEGISIIVHYDKENDEFMFIGLKEIAVVAMFSVSVEKSVKKRMEIGEYYFSSMLSKQKRDEFKTVVLNTFRISYGIKHFAPTEVKIVHDKNRRVQMGKGVMNKVTADSGLIVPVNIIDSSYLTTIIHVEATSVRGHFRLQPCGKQNHDRKMIWINPYEKGSYIRTAKKLDE
jgi:hypothetical protein